MAATSGIDVQGLKEALAALDELQLRATDQTPVWAEVGKLLQAVTRAKFSFGGAPAEWPARKHAVPWPALNKTGNLLASIAAATGPTFVKQRATARYGWYHQVGSTGSKSITSTAAAKAIAEGAKYAPGRKGGNTRVLIDGKWVNVAKRGSYKVEIAGFGKSKAKAMRIMKRERSGRGGIASRPFLALEEQQIQDIQQELLTYLTEVFGSGTAEGVA